MSFLPTDKLLLGGTSFIANMTLYILGGYYYQNEMFVGNPNMLKIPLKFDAPTTLSSFQYDSISIGYNIGLPSYTTSNLENGTRYTLSNSDNLNTNLISFKLFNSLGGRLSRRNFNFNWFNRKRNLNVIDTNNGNYSKDYSLYVKRLDLSNNNMLTKLKLKVDSLGYSICQRSDNQLIIFGGQHTLTGKILNNVYLFDIVSQSLHHIKVNDSPYFAYHTSTCIDNTMYVLGGIDSDGKYNSMSELKVFNLINFNWSTVKLQGTVPEGRELFTTTNLNQDRLLVVGGRGTNLVIGSDNTTINDEIKVFSDMHILNLKTNQWSTTSTNNDNLLKPARFGHTTIKLGSYLMTIGGISNNLDEVYKSNDFNQNLIQLYDFSNLKSGIKLTDMYDPKKGYSSEEILIEDFKDSGDSSVGPKISTKSIKLVDDQAYLMIIIGCVIAIIFLVGIVLLLLVRQRHLHIHKTQFNPEPLPPNVNHIFNNRDLELDRDNLLMSSTGMVNRNLLYDYNFNSNNRLEESEEENGFRSNRNSPELDNIDSFANSLDSTHPSNSLPPHRNYSPPTNHQSINNNTEQMLETNYKNSTNVLFDLNLHNSPQKLHGSRLDTGNLSDVPLDSPINLNNNREMDGKTHYSTISSLFGKYHDTNLLSSTKTTTDTQLIEQSPYGINLPLQTSTRLKAFDEETDDKVGLYHVKGEKIKPPPTYPPPPPPPQQKPSSIPSSPQLQQQPSQQISTSDAHQLNNLPNIDLKSNYATQDSSYYNSQFDGMATSYSMHAEPLTTSNYKDSLDTKLKDDAFNTLESPTFMAGQFDTLERNQLMINSNK